MPERREQHHEQQVLRSLRLAHMRGLELHLHLLSTVEQMFDKVVEYDHTCKNIKKPHQNKHEQMATQ